MPHISAVYFNILHGVGFEIAFGGVQSPTHALVCHDFGTRIFLRDDAFL